MDTIYQTPAPQANLPNPGDTLPPVSDLHSFHKQARAFVDEMILALNPMLDTHEIVVEAWQQGAVRVTTRPAKRL